MKVFSGAVLCWLLLASCDGQASPQSGALYDLKVGDRVLKVELAVTTAEKAYGLMKRPTQPADQGMLFVFKDEAPRNFWMKDTLIPLSIAYISKSGVIKEILDMEALSLKTVPSRYAVMYALEMNLGAFARLGLKVGDQVDLAAVASYLQALKKAPD